jgi:hypothetical protein
MDRRARLIVAKSGPRRQVTAAIRIPSVLHRLKQGFESRL